MTLFEGFDFMFGMDVKELQGTVIVCIIAALGLLRG